VIADALFVHAGLGSGRRCFTPRAGVVIKMILTNRRSKGVQVKTLKGARRCHNWQFTPFPSY
jgi:hypothetical protein